MIPGTTSQEKHQPPPISRTSWRHRVSEEKNCIWPWILSHSRRKCQKLFQVHNNTIHNPDRWIMTLRLLCQSHQENMLLSKMTAGLLVVAARECIPICINRLLSCSDISRHRHYFRFLITHFFRAHSFFLLPSSTQPYPTLLTPHWTSAFLTDSTSNYE